METIETIYGTSVGLEIPNLKCNRSEIALALADGEVDCNREDAFAREKRDPSRFVDTSEYILDIINASVDFFVQYYSISIHDSGIYSGLILRCVENKNIFAPLFDEFTKKKKQFSFDHINSDFNIVLNMGRRDMTVQVIRNIKIRQKISNLCLLALSYKVLSMSGILGIHIHDIEYVIKNEKKRQHEQEQSFILQFLPKDSEFSFFQYIELFFLRSEMNGFIFQKVKSLIPPESDGGSKRVVVKKNNKHRTNKYKYNNKHKMNARKSRKRKCCRRESMQNKMF
jgi:hypothetical protein